MPPRTVRPTSDKILLFDDMCTPPPAPPFVPLPPLAERYVPKDVVPPATDGDRTPELRVPPAPMVI